MSDDDERCYVCDEVVTLRDRRGGRAVVSMLGSAGLARRVRHRRCPTGGVGS